MIGKASGLRLVGSPVAKLTRCLRVWDVVLVTVGAIIGSGIFGVPSVVARHAQTPELIIVVWVVGGATALAGAFVFGELAARRPVHGGMYAYLRDAYHPVVAFLFGWMRLMAAGTAAAALLFAAYFQALTGVTANPNLIAAIAVVAIVTINCLGCRRGSNAQNLLVSLKLAAIAVLIAFGFIAHTPPSGLLHPSALPAGTFAGAAAAMIYVLFAYNGWQTTSFLTGEMKNPAAILPLGIFAGVGIVTILYILVNVVSLHALGATGLAATDAPASAVLNLAMGPIGKMAIALMVMLSTLGLISNTLLAQPRLYHAMAEDGSFFGSLAWVHPRTHAPVMAIAVQAGVVLILTLSGTYERMLVYSTSLNFLFLGLASVGLFILRKHADSGQRIAFTVPGHPVTTLFFIAAAFGVVLAAYISDPRDSAIGLALLLSGLPVYAFSVYRHRHAAVPAAP